jgi:glutamine synthetase adenylyltransferase
MRGYLASFMAALLGERPTPLSTVVRPPETDQPPAMDPVQREYRNYLSRAEQRKARRSARASSREQRRRMGILELIRSAPGRASAESLLATGNGYRNASEDTRRKWRKAVAAFT